MVKSRAVLVHLLRSVETLNSLIRLIDSIPNMVIGDHIRVGIRLCYCDLKNTSIDRCIHTSQNVYSRLYFILKYYSFQNVMHTTLTLCTVQ